MPLPLGRAGPGRCSRQPPAKSLPLPADPGALTLCPHLPPTSLSDSHAARSQRPKAPGTWGWGTLWWGACLPPSSGCSFLGHWGRPCEDPSPAHAQILLRQGWRWTATPPPRQVWVLTAGWCQSPFPSRAKGLARGRHSCLPPSEPQCFGGVHMQPEWGRGRGQAPACEPQATVSSRWDPGKSPKASESLLLYLKS